MIHEGRRKKRKAIARKPGLPERRSEDLGSESGRFLERRSEDSGSERGRCRFGVVQKKLQKHWQIAR